MNEKIYLVTVIDVDDDYETPDGEFEGIYHSVLCVGAYTNVEDARNKRLEIIKNGVFKDFVEIIPIQLNDFTNKNNSLELFGYLDIC